MLGTLALSAVVLVQPSFDFLDFGPYDGAVPRPEQILGYGPGERHTVFLDQERVIRGIAEKAKARVRLIDYGKSTQGRPLRVAAISSPANIARLEQIRQDQLTLANPKPGQDLAAIKKRVPAIVWINQCIHGDETASFESAMWLLYTLAASRSQEMNRILDNTLVILNPVYNPDGHERYVVAYNSLPNGNPEEGSYDQAVPQAFYGRSNHYRFDMNRDRVALSQDETRQEVALFLQWNPHVYADQHGQVGTYFFPPVQQSVNANMDRSRYIGWTEVIGQATGAAFDARGWTYYVRDQFDFYNVCYLDTHATLMGAIGMTHETDGGRELASRRSDGSLLTLRDGMAKHLVSALAVIKSGSDNREKLIQSYDDYKQAGVSGSHAGDFQRVILTSEDPRPLVRLAEHLGRSGIQTRWTSRPYRQPRARDLWGGEAADRDIPAGSLVVDMAQPLGQLAKAWLEVKSDFEPEFVERQKTKAKNNAAGQRDPELDSFEFYDSTAWSLPLAYGLQAWWSPERPSFPEGSAPVREDRWADSPVGWKLEYTDQDDILFVARALAQGIRCAVATKPMKLPTGDVAPGTFLFLAARNEEGFGGRLKVLAREAKVNLEPLRTSYPVSGRQGPGSDSVVWLKPPRIGVVFGSSGSLAGGPLWYLLEREFKLPFFGLTAAGAAQEADNYTCLVFPSGARGVSAERIKQYVDKGGVVVSLSDPEMVNGSGRFTNLSVRSADPDLPGSFFRADIDPLHWLAFGYRQKEIAVPVDGSRFYVASPGAGPVTLSGDPAKTKLLSGWQWDGTEKDLAGISWAFSGGSGRGQAVAFTNDPTFRAQYPGLYKMLLNAMILGPSL